MNKTYLYYFLQVVAWSIFSIAHILFTVMNMPLNANSIINGLFIGGTGFFVTHCLRLLFLTRWWQCDSLLSLLLRVAVLLFLGAALWEALIIFVLHIALLKFYDFQSISLVAAAFWYYYYLVVLTLWVMLYLGVNQWLRRREEALEKLRLELALKDAQLKNLKNQLNPHFLFNALNSLRALILEDPERSREMITQLANLLRYCLRESQQNTTSLTQELEAVRAYLQLEKVRFEDRLSYRFRVPDFLGDERVLPMSIQTLVENSVKHGIANLTQGGEIEVGVTKEGSRLWVTVINPGTLKMLDAADQKSTGTGVQNTRMRLKKLFGDDSDLIVREDSQKVVVTMAWSVAT